MPKQPHRLRRKKPEPPRETPVAGILASITALDEDQMELLWGVMEAAMRDEWDCSLSTGFELFGNDELRIMTRTATLMAQHAEENGQ